jgi:phosphate transport system permease
MRDIKVFKPQIYQKHLYLTHNQAKIMGYNESVNKVAKIGLKLYEIRYVDDEQIQKELLKVRG